MGEQDCLHNASCLCNEESMYNHFPSKSINTPSYLSSLLCLSLKNADHRSFTSLVCECVLPTLLVGHLATFLCHVASSNVGTKFSLRNLSS